MTTGSSPSFEGRSLIIRRRTASFQLACGHLTARAFVGHAWPLDLRSARAWFPRDCRLASHYVAVPPACFALLVWKASGDPKCGERSSPVAPRARTVGREPVRRAAATPKDHSGTRTPADLIPPSRKKGGRSFGAALSEVAIVRTPTSSAGLATGQAMSRSPIGGSPVPGLAAALWCSRYALCGL